MKKPAKNMTRNGKSNQATKATKPAKAASKPAKPAKAEGKAKKAATAAGRCKPVFGYAPTAVIRTLAAKTSLTATQIRQALAKVTKVAHNTVNWQFGEGRLGKAGAPLNRTQISFLKRLAA